MRIICGISLLSAVLLTAPAAAGDLSVEVGGIRSADGTVNVGLHAETAGVRFPGENGMIAGSWRQARIGSLQVVFAGLPAGRYAVAVHHDENGNGELDTNLIGQPVEGYGFANDAMGFMNPPEFAEASVEVGDKPVSITVNLGY